MAAMFFLLVALCCIQAITPETFEMDMEEMHAIQERLSLLEGIEKAVHSAEGESRADDCIALGNGCSFTGAVCCGLRTRCVLFDHYTPKQGGGANIWHSVCREYPGGKAADEVVNFFKKLGK